MTDIKPKGALNWAHKVITKQHDWQVNSLAIIPTKQIQPYIVLKHASTSLCL